MATGGRIAGVIFAGLFALLSACAPVQGPGAGREPLEQVLHDHVNVLASDRFGGRATGSVGEELTLDYLQSAFVQAGLESGTHDPAHPWREPFTFIAPDGMAVTSTNVIGRIAGSEPQDGAVLVLAHWDHLGKGPPCPPHGRDRICNGAADNASGLAMLIEIARAMAAGPQPVRDIYFMATGAEETGFGGSAAFVRDPPVPLGKFVAAFNLDTEGVVPAGGPFVVIARHDDPEVTRLDAVIGRIAAQEGLAIVDPADAVSHYLRRQDGFVLAQAGVPAVMISAAFADPARMKDFLDTRYHRPGDEADRVELGAATRMVRFHQSLLRAVSDPATYPRPVMAEIPASAP